MSASAWWCDWHKLDHVTRHPSFSEFLDLFATAPPQVRSPLTQRTASVYSASTMPESMLKILRSRGAGSMRAQREMEPTRLEDLPEEKLREEDLVSLYRSAHLLPTILSERYLDGRWLM